MAPEAAVIAVRIAHVLLATLWLGASAYANLLLMPTLNQVSEAARGEVMAKMGRKTFKFINMVGGFTVLTGAVLYYWTHGSRIVTFGERLILFGALVSLSVLYLLNMTMRPAMMRMGQIAAKGKPDDEARAMMMLLQRRIKTTGMVAFVLVVVAACVMVAGTHYVG